MAEHPSKQFRANLTPCRILFVVDDPEMSDIAEALNDQLTLRLAGITIWLTSPVETH